VDLYLLHDDTPKPVVILLQGSGCLPLFTIDGDGTYHPTSLFQDVVPVESRRVHFAMIEKPGVSPLKFAAGMSREEKLGIFESAALRCTRDFVDHETKTVRVDDVRTVMSALAGQPWVTGFMLAGHSEGTHVATGILKARPAERMLAAGLFASAGPTPFWSGYVAADSGGSRAAFDRALNRIRMLQKADDDFMLEGHPARRWKTYTLESTPMDDVRESAVPLFVAQGTRDGTTLAADLFVLEAVRQQPRRPVRYAVIEGGDHAFETADGRPHVGDLFDDFLDWALDPSRATGTTVVH
jgi:surfactin synthase thioesterase subunit